MVCVDLILCVGSNTIADIRGYPAGQYRYGIFHDQYTFSTALSGLMMTHSEYEVKIYGRSGQHRSSPGS